MTKLYYTVEADYEQDWLTGTKSVSVYKIVDNEPVGLYPLGLELELEDNTEEMIIDELDSDDYPDKDDIELIRL